MHPITPHIKKDILQVPSITKTFLVQRYVEEGVCVRRLKVYKDTAKLVIISSIVHFFGNWFVILGVCVPIYLSNIHNLITDAKLSADGEGDIFLVP